LKLSYENFALLQETIGDFVKNMLESQDDCEVDPMKMPSTNASVLDAHRHLLMLHVEAVWTRILTSASNFPIELHEVFCELRKRLAKANRNDIVDNLISSSIFLRFLCPAIMSPSLFKLVSHLHIKQQFPKVPLV
jgi:RAS protein activator-like 2